MSSNQSKACSVTLQMCVYIALFFLLSATALSKAPEAVPNSPTNLSVLERSFDFIYLVWDDNSDDEDNFIVERHTEGSDFATYATLPTNTAYYIDYDVTPDTKYYYRVYAANTDGSSEYSNEIDTSTYDLPNRPPASPSKLTGDFDDINRNVLNWQDNSENENSFKIFRGENESSISVYDTLLRDVNTYSDYLINSNTSYYYYVIAENSYGTSEPSDTLHIDVGEINAEEPLLTLEQITATEVTLSWNQATNLNTSYFLHRTSKNDSVNIALTDTALYIDSGLSANTDYQYQLELINLDIGSSYSEILNVKTLPWFTQYRKSDSLVLFYVFSQMNGTTLPDQSWYGEPSNLVLQDTSGAIFVDSSYLRLEQNNVLISNSNSKVTEACRRSGELTLECWIKASELPDDGPVNILSLENENTLAFSLSCIRDAQDSKRVAYFANLTTRSTDKLGNPDFRSEHSVNTGILQHVVYTHNRFGEQKLYIDGQLTNEGYRPPEYDNWETNYKLLLGNKLDGEAFFRGSYYMCAVYNKALTAEIVSQNYYASPFAENDYILNSQEYTMNAFPNPSGDADKLMIDFINEYENLEITRSYTVMLVNPQGFIVRRQEVSDILNIESAVMDVSGLDPGLYSLILINPYGIIDTKNIVISR